MCAQRAPASAEGRESPPRPRLKRSERSEPKTGRGGPTGPRAQDGAREEHTKHKEEGDEGRTREHLKRSDRREPKADDAAHATDDHYKPTDTHHTQTERHTHPEGGTGGGATDRTKRGRGARARGDPRKTTARTQERATALPDRARFGERGTGGKGQTAQPPEHSRPDYNRHYGQPIMASIIEKRAATSSA